MQFADPETLAENVSHTSRTLATSSTGAHRLFASCKFVNKDTDLALDSTLCRFLLPFHFSVTSTARAPHDLLLLLPLHCSTLQSACVCGCSRRLRCVGAHSLGTVINANNSNNNTTLAMKTTTTKNNYVHLILHSLRAPCTVSPCFAPSSQLLRAHVFPLSFIQH